MDWNYRTPLLNYGRLHMSRRSEHPYPHEQHLARSRSWSSHGQRQWAGETWCWEFEESWTGRVRVYIIDRTLENPHKWKTLQTSGGSSSKKPKQTLWDYLVDTSQRKPGTEQGKHSSTETNKNREGSPIPEDASIPNETTQPSLRTKDIIC